MKLILFSLIVFIQAVFTNQPDKADINILKERIYKGEALYGYMNGGSDLYLEYGFRELSVLDINFKGNIYSVEMYDMSNPESAFGIFSQNAFKCKPYDKIYKCDCTSPKQYQAIKGKFYLSVVYENNSEASRADAYEIAEYMFNKYEAQGEFVTPDIVLKNLKPEDKLSQVLKYCCAPISLSNSISGRMYLFEDLNSYKVWILRKEDESKIVSIKFNSEKDAELFLERINNNQEGLSVEVADSSCLNLKILSGF
ncbi:MAG: hypothetical protein QMB47_03145 [Bacteroidales bacterium]